jgi:hypothetical protein
MGKISPKNEIKKLKNFENIGILEVFSIARRERGKFNNNNRQVSIQYLVLKCIAQNIEG